jgi:TolB-like protein/class 3 adenylate cyclase
MAPRAERKLAAILAADVVGYSRLVGADEAGTLARVKAHRVECAEPLIVEYRGRVVKLTGDGALVEFESAVDAVECAIAIQKGMAEREAGVPADQRIHYRIGINIGDIVREDGDIFGDGVNIAARLEGLADPGGICIARNVYNQVKNKIAFSFEPMGEHRVKNIAEPIIVYRVRPGPGGLTKLRAWTVPASRRRRQAAMAAAVAMLLAAGVMGGWYALWRPGELPTTNKASIAVLPFDNLSGDEPTGRLADGLTEDVITDLARFRDLDVIARNSTMAYKGKPADVREVGRALDVRYVLEGSIQRQDERLRVTAQLVDAGSGAHVWSERWERPAIDLFAVQSEIAERVAARLGGGISYGAITSAEVQRAKRHAPASLNAYEHYLFAAEAKAQSSETLVRKGLEHAEMAIALDPNFPRAYTVRGWLHYFTISFREDYARAFAKAGADFRKAVELDPLDAEARIALAYWLGESGDFVQAVAEARKALAMSPSHVHVLVAASSLLAYAGEVEEALAAAERAIRLDPHMPPGLLRGVKDAFFFSRDFERTIDVVRRMPEDSRSQGSVFELAASYAFLGRAEVKEARAAMVAKYGDASAELWLNQGWVFGRQEERDLFIESFRKLGLPVCASEAQLEKYSDMKRLPQCDPESARS